MEVKEKGKVAVLLSDKTYFKTKSVKETKEDIT